MLGTIPQNASWCIEIITLNITVEQSEIKYWLAIYIYTHTNTAGKMYEIKL